MEKKRNFVNRIGKMRGHRNIAISVAVVAIGVAVAGWHKALAPITDLQILQALHGKIHLQTDCETYAETMCNEEK